MPRWPASLVAHGTTTNERFGRSKPGRHAHRVAQAEPRDDVVRDLRRGGRGRRDDRLRAEPARGIGEPEVVRPEVVAPLRDAVRLVDDEQPDPRLPDPLQEAGRGEALRRHVEQPRAARHGALDGRAVGGRVLLRVDERHHARRGALERLDLVLHQRDERRDDQRQVGAHQRRQLVAERLARAGGHHDQHVAPGERGLDRLAAGRGGSRRSRTPRAAPRPARWRARTAAAARVRGPAAPARSAGR